MPSFDSGMDGEDYDGKNKELEEGVIEWQGDFLWKLFFFAVDISTPPNDGEMPEESFHESTESEGEARCSWEFLSVMKAIKPIKLHPNSHD